MQLTLSRLRRGEIVAGISSVALLVLLFGVGWLSTGPADHRTVLTGFSAMPVLCWFLLVAALLGLLATIFQATRPAPALPVTLDTLSTTVGALTTLLLIIWLLVHSGDIRLGAVLGLIACAGVTAGAFMALRQEDGWIPGPDHPIETVSIAARPSG